MALGNDKQNYGLKTSCTSALEVSYFLGTCKHMQLMQERLSLRGPQNSIQLFLPYIYEILYSNSIPILF